MRAQQEKSPHRLSHEEVREAPRDLRTFGKGDVVMRQGSPHIVLELDSSTVAAVKAHHSPGDVVYVCNLQTGAAWPVSASEQVWPCYDVNLAVKTARRGE